MTDAAGGEDLPPDAAALARAGVAGDALPRPQQAVRTFVLSGMSSGLSLLYVVVFISLVGVGFRSDAYFAALAVATTLVNVLFMPYESFAIRIALERLREREEPVWPLLLSYVALCTPALLFYYLLAEPLLARAFGSVYTSHPALWRGNLYWLGAMVVLSGAATIAQTCAQARGQYDLPKVAMAVGRGVGLVVLGATFRHSVYCGSIGLVAANLVTTLWSVVGIRPGGAPRASLLRTTRRILREWLQVAKWSALLRTEILLERALAANVRPGFLTVFNFVWSAVMSAVEGYQAAVVAVDSNRYFEVRRRAAGGESLREAFGVFRRSRAVARWLAGAFALALGALVAGILGLGLTARISATVPGKDYVILAITGALALLVHCVWKQLAAIYVIRGRSVDFAMYLVVVYVVLAGPRIWLTWAWSSAGFCLGAIAYPTAQVGLLAFYLLAAGSRRATVRTLLRRSGPLGPKAWWRRGP